MLNTPAAKMSFEGLIDEPAIETSIASVESSFTRDRVAIGADDLGAEPFDADLLRELTDDERDHINLAVALLFAVLTTQYAVVPTLAAEITAGVWMALRYGTRRLL